MNNFGRSLASLACLAGCGPLYDDSMAQGFMAVVTEKLAGDAAEAAPAAPAVTAAQVAANPGSFLMVTAYGGASVAMMVKAATNGPRETWISADNVTVTLENGIIVATRGLPRDLIAADVNGVAQTLAAGGGSATRRHETIDDLDQISTELLQCSIVFAGSEAIAILGQQVSTRRFSETCQSENLAFTNTYWVNGAGAITRSLQAIAPASGYLQVDVL